MNRANYKTGTLLNKRHPFYNSDELWIPKSCPECGAQLYAWDSGQGCGVCCSECNYQSYGSATTSVIGDEVSYIKIEEAEAYIAGLTESEKEDKSIELMSKIFTLQEVGATNKKIGLELAECFVLIAILMGHYGS